MNEEQKKIFLQSFLKYKKDFFTEKLFKDLNKNEKNNLLNIYINTNNAKFLKFVEFIQSEDPIYNYSEKEIKEILVLTEDEEEFISFLENNNRDKISEFTNNVDNNIFKLYFTSKYLEMNEDKTLSESFKEKIKFMKKTSNEKTYSKTYDNFKNDLKNFLGKFEKNIDKKVKLTTPNIVIDNLLNQEMNGILRKFESKYSFGIENQARKNILQNFLSIIPDPKIKRDNLKLLGYKLEN